MTGGWKTTYEELTKYVADNSDIEITRFSVALPDGKREIFYAKLDEINAQFVEENFSNELIKSQELVDHWNETESKILAYYPGGIETPKNILRYLKDPLKELSNELYDPLMKVFKGIITLEQYEETALKSVRENWAYLFKHGYTIYLVAELVCALDPEETWMVPNIDNNRSGTDLEANPGGGMEANVPVAEKTDKFIYEHSPQVDFVTAKILIQSKKLGRLVAIRPNFFYPVSAAKTRSKNQEWLSMDEIKQVFGPHDLWPDVLIDLANDARDIAVMADNYYLCQPHFNIEIREKDDWFSVAAIASVKRHAEVTEPKVATFIMSRTPYDEEAMKDALLPKEIDMSQMGDMDPIEFIAKAPEPEPTGDVVIENIADGTAVMVEEIAPEEPTPSEATDETEAAAEENPEPAKLMEPELAIHPVCVGYDPSQFAELIDLMASVPPYPPVEW